MANALGATSPLQEVTEELRQIRNHRFLQSMVYLVLFVYGNVLYFAQTGRAAHAVGWGFFGISLLFLGIEVGRARNQTRIQPRLHSAEEVVNALAASALYAGGAVYWTFQAVLG